MCQSCQLVIRSYGDAVAEIGFINVTRCQVKLGHCAGDASRQARADDERKDHDDAESQRGKQNDQSPTRTEVRRAEHLAVQAVRGVSTCNTPPCFPLRLRLSIPCRFSSPILSLALPPELLNRSFRRQPEKPQP